ncbi:hypothetical protein BG004_002728 [Podila humilis]|nr:hypothetical protein BG004_002728 [Podila humilis]
MALPSPFARAKSFQAPHNRGGNNDSQSGQDSSTAPPFTKRAFTRTLSNPFQVLSPSLGNTKNPFEKLSKAKNNNGTTSPFTKISSASLPEDYSVLNINEDGESEDEAMDPNKTLRMFSFSQSSQQPNPELDQDDDDDEEEEDDEDEDKDINKDDITGEGSSNDDTPTLFDSHQSRTQRPLLHEALEMSINRKRKSSKELELPVMLNSPSFKRDSGAKKFTRRTIPPLDWSLKSGMSITSPDDLSWCDQRSPSDDIAALQKFNSQEQQQQQQTRQQSQDQEISRINVMAAVYHWTYPTNSPSAVQAESINRLLKSATNMTANEKNSISEMFSRTAECSLSLSGEFEATLTYSTPGLRKVLIDEEIGYIQLPEIAGVKAVSSFSSKHDLEGFEDDATEQNSETTSKLPKEQSLSNTLLFKGYIEVHGLFTYLLHLKTSYEDGFLYQSPTLTSSVPFLHAALKRAQGSDKVQKEFRIEIQGTLLPMSVKHLLSLFGDRVTNGCTFATTTDVRSHGLNLRPLHKEPPQSQAKNAIEPFVSPKALDLLRYDKSSLEYSW